MAWENAFNQQLLELALTEEDVEELRSERTIKHTKVTNEEIEQLTIDESLPPLERLVFILRSGQDIQKVNAIGSLYDILQQEKGDSNVLPLIGDVISSTVKEIQLSTAHVLCRVLKDRLLNSESFASMFLKRILNNLRSKDKEISEVWLETLLILLDSFLNHDSNEQVLNFLMCNGSLMHCSQTRKICCRLVSFLAKFFHKEKVCSYLIRPMRALCQDIELDVRSCMCSQIEEMIDNVEKVTQPPQHQWKNMDVKLYQQKHSTKVVVPGEEIVQEYILPELCLLFQDEETSVRHAALATISNLYCKLEPELLKRSNLIKLTQKFYRKTLFRKLPQDIVTASKFIGKVMYRLSVYLSPDEKSFYMDCYQVLCCQDSAERKILSDTLKNDIRGGGLMHNDHGSECRYWCAYNFPAVLASIPTESFKPQLLPSFLYLMKDSHSVVRSTMACSLHEVSKMLGEDVHLIYNAIKNCLKDKDLEVLHGILSGLPIILDCLHRVSARQNYVLDLIPLLSICERTICLSLRWRTHMQYFESIRCLHNYMTSDHIYYRFVPLLLNVLTANKVIPVKHAACHTLLTYVKYSHVLDERQEVCTRLISDLARSPSSRSRLLFLDVCKFTTQIFSKRFFKEFFYDVAMEMAVDPVVNVRIKFCTLLPVIKSQIRLPCDRLLLQLLEKTIRRIMALENDVDVSHTIRKAIIDLDSVTLSMDGMPATEEDIEDRTREREEENIVEECLHRKEVEGLHSRSRSQSATEKFELHLGRQRLSGSVGSKEQPKRATKSGVFTNASTTSCKKTSPEHLIMAASKVSRSKESCTTKVFSPSNSGSKLSSKKSSSHSTTHKKK